MGFTNGKVQGLFAFLAVFAMAVLTACGGNGGSSSINKLGPDPGWSFELGSDLDDPCASMDISTNPETSFPAGTTVTFTNAQGQSFNGDTSPSAGTTLYAGFPSGALAGDYDVYVQTPGGQKQLAGIVQYDDNQCKK